MNHEVLAPLRRELLARAAGEVAEIGFGSGVNLPYYPSSVHRVIAVEPSAPLFKRGRKRIEAFPGEVTPVAASGENLPLKSKSVDVVVLTFTLCSVANPQAVLSHAKRILKPQGKLLFLEHGLCPDRSVQKWQKRLSPIQERLAGGCRFDRNILGLLADACWDVGESRRFYVDGIPKVAGFVTLGEAG